MRLSFYKMKNKFFKKKKEEKKEKEKETEKAEDDWKEKGKEKNRENGDETRLPFFNEKHMHCSIRQYNENSTKDAEIDDVTPHRSIVESKRAENARSRHRDVQAVLLIYQRQIFDLVDNQGLEPVVEDG